MHIIKDRAQLLCNMDDVTEIQKSIEILKSWAVDCNRLAKSLQSAISRRISRTNRVVKSDIKRVTVAHKILTLLNEGPMRNNEIAFTLGISPAHVSIVCMKLRKQNKIYKKSKFSPWLLGNVAPEVIPSRQQIVITPVTDFPEISCSMI